MKEFPADNSRQANRYLTMGLWCMAGLLLLCHFGPLLFGGKTIIPADNLFQFAPYHEAAGNMGVGRPHIPLYSDLILQNYPWWQFIHQSLKSGQLPLWNPYILSGTPFLAKGQHMLLYPLSLLLYIIPLERAFSLFIVLHLGVAACSAAFLARTVGVSRYGSLLSGIIYGISGFMLARAVFPMIIAAAAWLPLILAMAERIIIRSRFRGHRSAMPWILLGAMGLGMQGLIGHPEFLIYTLLTLTFYSVCRCLGGKPERLKSSVVPVAFNSLTGVALMIILGLLIGSAQILPQYLVLQDNFRQHAADFKQILSWSLPWQQAITMLVPNYFGNPAQYAYTNLFNGLLENLSSPISWGTKNFVEGAIYVGILPLLLALASLHRRPRLPTSSSPDQQAAPSPLLFFAITVLAACFAFGTPLYYLIYMLPGLEQVHSPFRWTLVSTLGIAILAGCGIDRIRQRPSLAFSTARYCAMGSVLIVISLLLCRFFFTQLEPLLKAILLQSGGNISFFIDLESFFSYEAPWFILLTIVLAIAGLALKVIGHTVTSQPNINGPHIWQPLVVLLIIADLLLYAYRLYPAANPTLLQYTPEIISRMKKDKDLWRFTTFDPEGRKSFPSNAGWLHTIQDIRGYDSIFSANYRRYMETIDIQDELLYNRIAPLRSPAALDSPLLDLLNVKYVMTEHQIDNPRYHLADHGEGVLVYLNTGTLPRAFTLPISSTVPAEDPFAAMLRYDPRFYMILPTADATDSRPFAVQPSKPTPGEPGEVTVDSYRNNEVILSLTAREPIWLILADSYDQGWKANASPVHNPDLKLRLPIRRAYGALRAVMLEPGAWVVRYRYRPVGFIIGLSLSLAGAVLTTTAALWFIWRHKSFDTAQANGWSN